MATTYVIFLRERIRDAEEIRMYSKKAKDSLKGHRVTPLTVYGRHATLEGAPTEGVVILKFPSFEEARAWYDGPAYRAARTHRFLGADYRALIVEGV